MLRMATAQSLITSDPDKNARELCALIRQAAAAGADCIHFSEAALSGYVKAQIKSWADVDWEAVDTALDTVRACCAETGLWAIVGCNHRHPDLSRPLNSLYVVDDHGRLAERYDKRFCSNTEITDWYAAGSRSVTVDIKGIRLGFLICIEVQFPELFLEYERLGVDCLCLSSGDESRMFRIQAQGHAACNCYWISYSVSANKRDRQPSCLIGPDGHIVAGEEPDESRLTVCSIDPSDPKWDIPLTKARPWRRKAREGEIYRGHRLSS
ncbi:carbon-nitrogen hydrolase family protein [Nisaea sediminum]|uniref:carbon-nitrogen hydrolase family protein n=1 Tax=Nisaea sediminum TaxID=2775867 RepID=UPI0018660AAE|nr:carbon-nitrogen hydrolase family protein [Nisaea sediminum]